ncbi:hypothetical protein POTOM_039293 [Populus tomentosa]|uniref:Secreted protein n=1 Tax=Populus tomentosa TaxID=118781 RepID=A0A8X8CIY4_POPTO|nr:hypothetical protein POTOM_039293 [Populus tomentosa]
MKESNSLCSRVAGREGWLLLILLLWLRKEMAAEEAPDGRVALLVSGCCWCWPWFSRGGAASCWDFSREAILRFRCCFSVTVGGRRVKACKWCSQWLHAGEVRSGEGRREACVQRESLG